VTDRHSRQSAIQVAVQSVSHPAFTEHAGASTTWCNDCRIATSGEFTRTHCVIEDATVEGSRRGRSGSYSTAARRYRIATAPAPESDLVGPVIATCATDLSGGDAVERGRCLRLDAACSATQRSGVAEELSPWSRRRAAGRPPSWADRQARGWRRERASPPRRALPWLTTRSARCDAAGDERNRLSSSRMTASPRYRRAARGERPPTDYRTVQPRKARNRPFFLAKAHVAVHPGETTPRGERVRRLNVPPGLRHVGQRHVRRYPSARNPGTRCPHAQHTDVERVN
jgi:hypothetical protein